MHPNLKQIGLALWLPGLAGALTFAITWLQWFLIEPACVPTETAPCPLLPWGRYITREILSQCIIHTALVMTVTGGSDAMLFIQERKRNEEQQKINEQQLADAREYNEQKLADAREYYEKRLADDRESRAEEQRLRAEEQRLRAEEQQRYEQRLADDQQRYEQRLDEDRELRAAEQQRYEQRLADDQQRYEQQLAADRERADRMAEKQEALLERTFQLLQEERNAAEAARNAAAAERQATDERIRRLEAQLADQQPPQA